MGAAPIAVREGMYGDEPMMDSNGDLIGRKSLVFAPIADIVEDDFDIRRDLPDLDADIAWRRPELTRPAPDLAEHALVRLTEEGLGEDVAARARIEGPAVAFADIDLFGFVQFATQRE